MVSKLMPLYQVLLGFYHYFFSTPVRSRGFRRNIRRGIPGGPEVSGVPVPSAYEQAGASFGAGQEGETAHRTRLRDVPGLCECGECTAITIATIHYPPANWPSNRVTKVPKLPCVCLSLAAHQRQTRFKCKHRCKVLGQDDDQSVGSCSNRTDGGQGFLRPGKSHTLVWQMQKMRLANKCNAYGYTVKEMGLLYRRKHSL